MSTEPTGPARSRRGFLLVEFAAAMLVLAVAMAVTVQILGWLAAERRSAERRQSAADEAANVLERLTLRPWDDLTPEAVRGVPLSDQARRVLPDGALSVQVAEAGKDVAMKRITVEVRWRDRAGGATKPVRLTAWVARRGRARR